MLTLTLGGYEFSVWRKHRSVEMEVAEVTEEARQYEEKNKELSESLAFLQSTASRERIARQQLNMKKEGEIVVHFPDTLTLNPDQKDEDKGTKRVNAETWWNYFFGELQ